MIQSPYNYQNNDARFRDVKYNAKPVILIEEVDTGIPLDRAICKVFGYDHNKVFGGRRFRDQVVPRQIFMYVLRVVKKYSYSNIGELAMGDGKKKYDHTTAMHAKKTVENLMDTDNKFKSDMSVLMSMVRNGLVKLP